ncbi:MAG: exodeoxyribonuclease III [Candidatus Omnitrophica bacterium]|nr:exodeoxyribonuclease III [Candidatus Omnitrophota bacterium]
MLKLLGWNVNGIRAVEKKGFLDWLAKESPDILCVQETKAHPDQLSPQLTEPAGYHAYWNSACRKGYSGVAVFTKEKPVSSRTGFDVPRFDEEGRVVELEFPQFTLLNIYFPNGKSGSERLQYKMDFYDETLKYIRRLREKGKSLIITGDVNTAHKPIDLKHPKANETISGFLPAERTWIDALTSYGYIDTLREFRAEPDLYTWWDLRTGARKRNVGWRIDYFYISKDLRPSLKDAFILPDVMGSDHCPVGILMELEARNHALQGISDRGAQNALS